MQTVLAYLMFLLTGMVMQSQSSVDSPNKDVMKDNEQVRIYELDNDCYQIRTKTHVCPVSVCMDNKYV